ncbi:MAG: ABC transporter permease [Bacteroidota bacterium]
MKKLADRLFAWFCHPDYYPDIKGDLEELYDRHLEAEVRFPDLKYTLDVLLLFRISLIRPITVFENSIINTAMIYNYLKVSIRTLMRQKVYSAINIIGLAVGLTGFLLINEYVQFEKSYDAFHTDADVLYRVSTVERGDGGTEVKDAMASYSSGEVLQEKIPEVLSHTVSKPIRDIIFRNGNVVFKEQKVISADSAFFDHFSYKLIKGNENEVFSDPLQVVLSESKARTYFGDEDPIGKTLEVLSPLKTSVTVTGVIEDIPVNTHYHFDILISDKTLAGMSDYKNWNFNNYYVYVKLHPETDLEALHKKADAVAIELFDEDNTDFWDFNKVENIYLQSDFTYEPQIQGSEKAVSFLAIISIFILLIAWINYVNLSTARAVDRAKEVGLRKVVGAFKMQLTLQFLFEALIINAVGALLALVMSELLLNYFNQLVGKEVLSHVWDNGPFLLNLVFFVVLGTFVSGIYPALVLSGFKPISVLKGKYANSKTGVTLRKGLVVAQFAASLVLIAATFTVQQQVNFMKGKDMGMNTDHVVMVSVPRSGAETQEQFDAYLSRFNTMKQEMKNHSAIIGLGATSSMPGGESNDVSSTTNKMGIPGMSEQLQSTTYLQAFDGDFVETVEMEILAGRDFDKSIATDTAALMVNQAFLARLNISDYASVIGKTPMILYRSASPSSPIISVFPMTEA